MEPIQKFAKTGKRRLENANGAAILIAGTSIGAAMITLPVITATIGLLWGTALLIIMCIVMNFAARVMVDINLITNSADSISSLSKNYLSPFFEKFSTFIILAMLNALLVAYASGAQDFMKLLLDKYTSIKLANVTIGLGFYSFMLLTLSISMRVLDNINRVLFAIMLLVFLCLLGSLLSNFTIDRTLVSYTGGSAINWFVAIPLFFTSFGFHGSLPTIINYCGRERKTINRAIFLGTLVPLIVYLLWIVGGLTALHSSSPGIYKVFISGKGDISLFIHTLSQTLNISWMSLLSWVFTLLAIITSFTGVAIGMIDFYREKLVHSPIKPKMQSFLAIVLTFLIPALSVVYIENLFHHILAFAGMLLSCLAILIPAAIWLKIYSAKKKALTLSKFGVVITLVFGVSIILSEIFHLSFSILSN